MRVQLAGPVYLWTARPARTPHPQLRRCDPLAARTDGRTDGRPADPGSEERGPDQGSRCSQAAPWKGFKPRRAEANHRPARPGPPSAAGKQSLTQWPARLDVRVSDPGVELGRRKRGAQPQSGRSQSGPSGL